jgi:hypothetical protein
MKKVKFYSEMPVDVFPIPAQKMIPDWWKKGENFISKEDDGINVLGKEDRAGGMKSCVPFLDAITSGYLILATYDIEITRNDSNVVEYRKVRKNEQGEWVQDYSPVTRDLITERPINLGHTIPRPPGCSWNHLAWGGMWGYDLPRGWSMLVTHPLNRWELPFVTTSAIVDGDNFPLSGFYPFFIKEGWLGVIEEGTPIIQMIPIKRETWMASFHILPNSWKKMADALRSVNYGYYRSNFWVKKKYLSEKNNKKELEEE